MNGNEVSEALGDVNGQFIAEALTYKRRKLPLWFPIAALAACLCLLVGLLIPTVSLPSFGGQMEVYYSDGIPIYSPIITQNGDSIVTEHASVTLDVSDFPSDATKDSFLSYASTVTLEFAFRNTSEEKVTANLTLPCGPIPTYFPYCHFMTEQERFNCDLSKYIVAVDGNPIHTSARLSGSDTLPLPNDSWENGVFSNNTLLTKLTYQVTKLESRDPFAQAGFHFRRTSLTPYLFYEGYARPDDKGRLCFGITEGSTIELYFVGSVPDELPQWGFYSSMKEAAPLEGNMELVSTESMTFLEYASRSWREEYGISVSDWACSIATELLYRDWGSIDGFIPAGIIDVRVTTYRWLDYSFTLDPGETVIHTITMPVYPSLSSGGNLRRCEYTLDLLSLRALHPIGQQALSVRTDFAMADSSVNFINIFGDYTVNLGTIKESTITFSLFASREAPLPNAPAPQPQGQVHWLTVLGSAVLVVLGFYWLFRRRKE